MVVLLWFKCYRLYSWSNIKEDLKQRLNKDVEFENDANCAALAEVWKGVACHENDCFLLLVEQELVEQLLKIVMFIMEMHYMWRIWLYDYEI